jgi:iron complex outermembrane receptor protein
MQIRKVNYEFEGFDNQLRWVDQSDLLTFFNPKAGLSYHFSERAMGYWSFAVGHKEPNRDDYVETTPAERPLPERLYNTEIGYKYRSDKVALEANLYHMYYLNQLVLNGEINDVGAYARVNIPYSYRLGLEINGGLSFGEHWRLDGNVAISKNKVIRHTIFEDSYDASFNWLGQEAVVYENTDLSFSPNFIGGGSLTYQIPFKENRNFLEIGWLHKYVSSQFIDNTSDLNNQLDGYYVSDLQVIYNRGGNIEINFLLGNIWDVRYETNAWSYRYRYEGLRVIDQGFYPQAGTHFFVGLKFQL